MGRVSPREVVQLKHALVAIEPIKDACSHSDNVTLQRIGEQLNLCESLRQRIESEIQPDPPQLVAKGDVIATGYSAELDDLRNIKELAELGVDAAILGKSLYARAFTLEEALEVAR